MWFKNIKIKHRLTIGFSVILTFLLLISVIAILYINKVWENTQKMYEHPFIVSNTMRDIKINMLNIRLFMVKMVNSKSGNIIAVINQCDSLINNEEKIAYQNLEKVKTFYLGNINDVENIYTDFKNWKNIRDEAINTLRAGNIIKGQYLILERNSVYVNEILINAQIVINYANNKAKTFYYNSEKVKNHFITILWQFVILTVILVIILSYYITKSITKPLKALLKNTKEISEGNLNNNQLPESADEYGQLNALYNQMQHNLMHKANIAHKIAQGNFSVRVATMGNSDLVANAINMIAENFEMVVKQAQNIAAGNFEIQIEGISKTNQLSVVIIQMLNSLKEVVESALKIAEGDYSGQIIPKSDSDQLAHALNQMTVALRKVTIENQRQNKLKSALNELNEKMRGDLDLAMLSKNIVSFIAHFTNAQIGAFYLYNSDQNNFQLSGSFAFNNRKGVQNNYSLGEGLIGQAALEKEIILFNNLPDNYLHITSGIGNTVPRCIIVVPFVYNKQTIAVIELGSVSDFSDIAIEFLNLVSENIAISIVSATNRQQMAKLLAVTKEQAEELQVQQEELRQTNEELESQTKALRKSEEYLQAQQEELRVTNEELEEKTRNLEKQKSQIEKQNHDLEISRIEIEQKAHELEITNKYKSEFLANMSHELRTPLNSLLILSQSLTENTSKNLTPDQIESATIIYNSGNDLLNLINDILDLSKIESGKMKLSFESLAIEELINSIRSYFNHVLKQKGLEFKLYINPDVPKIIKTDIQRLNQIVRNLMSNAIKFTEKGSITLSIYIPQATDDLSRSGLNINNTIAISVKDTGIGIALEKQHEIFEAFLQADGSISRKYGGTGLGLSITRELTKLLGGEVKLNSQPGYGAEFIIYIPLDSSNLPAPIISDVKLNTNNTQTYLNVPFIKSNSQTLQKPPTVPSITDDRSNTTKNDKSILIVEDDTRFAEILALMCRQKGFKCLASSTGEEGIELAIKHQPLGIILDINLPGIDGWEVLQQLKNNAETRHIPVHIMSGYEENIDAYAKGAIGYLTKPASKAKIEAAFNGLQTFITKKIKDLLIIEDDDNLRKSIKTLLEATDIEISECNTGAKAIDIITSQNFDCVVLDLGLPDMTGFELLKKLKENNIKTPPIIIHTGRDLSIEENDELQKYTRNIIVKGVKSDERLLDETALFLHRVVDDMPEHQRKMLTNLYDKDQMFRNKIILVVDDDMRNIFALTQVLEAAKIKVIMAPNGQKAIEMLNIEEKVDLILMDIMMPIMDGYEAMQKIRTDKRFTKLPIIALTAKAMKEDREKSIAAGASDYLSKPVDVQKLFNLMRIWLYQ